MVKVSAVLLGAGESKRMGVDKLSLPWGKRTVFDHCLRTLLQSEVEEVIVVLSNRTKELMAHVRGGRVKVVMNPYYRRGMSTSIRRAIQAIHLRSQGILIALGDQPLLKTRTVNALIRVFIGNKGGIVVPSFKGRRGHPVIFDRKYEKELLKLRKDAGGRSILRRYSESVLELRTRSEGVVKDMDTWEEYKKELRVRSCQLRVG